MPRYQTLLFDLDGTLLDTLEDLTQSLGYALESCHFPRRNREEVRRFVGNGLEALVRRALPPQATQEDCQRVLAVFRPHYAQHHEDHTTPYPGILPMLAALQKRGCQLGIVSNKADPYVKALCRSHFGEVLALGEVPGIPRKPAPEMVRQVMRLLGADPATTLYIGDSEVDVGTARNAGLPCLAVTWGFRSEAELREQGAAHFARTPQEMLDFVEAAG